MNSMESWIFKKIAKQEVIQVFDHKAKIIEMYSIITKCAREQFTEDNKITLDIFLSECHRESLNSK